MIFSLLIREDGPLQPERQEPEPQQNLQEDVIVEEGPFYMHSHQPHHQQGASQNQPREAELEEKLKQVEKQEEIKKVADGFKKEEMELKDAEIARLTRQVEMLQGELNTARSVRPPSKINQETQTEPTQATHSAQTSPPPSPPVIPRTMPSTSDPSTSSAPKRERNKTIRRKRDWLCTKVDISSRSRYDNNLCV
ncbi:hypothetical protein CRE_07599 [Caenorhabditis remanei]|uniref:Uncharacterized protein n=1 Tax=Caenorhabditis remanei TaxID=31234 RepID=E3MP71_CAERE|nr:hypothetical protein CRE_07599 [Caenorhabditis remanei]